MTDESKAPEVIWLRYDPKTTQWEDAELFDHEAKVSWGECFEYIRATPEAKAAGEVREILEEALDAVAHQLTRTPMEPEARSRLEDRYRGWHNRLARLDAERGEE